MSKDAYWFPHDSNARSDPKMLRLRMLCGVEGIGFYWCVIEFLREQDSYSATEEEIACLEFEMRPIQANLLQGLVDSGLLVNEDNMFYSPSLLRRMEQWEEKKKRRQDAGRKGGLQKSSNAKAMLKQRQSNAVAMSTYNRTEQKSTEENNTPKPPTGAKTEYVYSKDFLEWYEIYPKKTDKLAASKKFKSALKIATFDQLKEGARKYAAQRKGQDPQFTASPAIWLNKGKWDDEVTQGAIPIRAGKELQVLEDV